MKERVTIAVLSIFFSLPITSASQSPSPIDPAPTSSAQTQPTTSPSPRVDSLTSLLAKQDGTRDLAVEKLDAILTELRGISGKIQPVQAGSETLFTKLKDDYLSNLVWEFLGYHRGKGGYLPFIVTLITFVTALLKLWLTFASKQKDRPVYLTLDAAVSVVFFGLAGAALWVIFGGPMVAPTTPVDLSPIQSQLAQLQVSADRLAASQATVDPQQFSKLLAQAARACSELRETNQAAFASVHGQISAIPASVPGYGCMSLILVMTAIGATAAIWLLGLKKEWW